MSAGLVLGGFCSVPSRSCRVYGLRQFVHGVNVRALEELEDVDWPVDCVEVCVDPVEWRCVQRMCSALLGG